MAFSKRGGERRRHRYPRCADPFLTNHSRRRFHLELLRWDTTQREGIDGIRALLPQAAEKIVYFVIPSEARNLFDRTPGKEREILRFAQNDKRSGANFSAASPVCGLHAASPEPDVAGVGGLEPLGRIQVRVVT
jgi:hypothetical protein